MDQISASDMFIAAEVTVTTQPPGAAVGFGSVAEGSGAAAEFGSVTEECSSLTQFVRISQNLTGGLTPTNAVPRKITEAPLMLGAEIRPEVRKPSDLQEIYNMLNHSLALGTIANYKSVINKFASFLSTSDVDIASFSRHDLERFLGFAGDQNFSYSFWSNIKPALRWLEQVLDREETVFYGRINLLIQGGQRFAALSKPPTQKPTAIDADTIRFLIDKFILPYTADLYLINGEMFRSVYKEVLKFKTLCRFDCYAKLQAFHFTDNGSHITIYFPGAKNDQHHNGNIAVLDSSDSRYCSAQLTRLYFQRFGLKFSNSGVKDENYINFVVRNKVVSRIINGSEISSLVQVADGRKSLCRSNSTTGSKKMFQLAGIELKYSEKGAKVGGVSAGFDNGMTKEEVQIAGRWHTDSVSLWYKQNSEVYKLQVASKIVL